MYIINSFRALALILLAAILIVKEVPFKPLFKDAMIQFYLALTCMLFLLLVDNIFGFLLSICLLSLYFRIYTSELQNKKVGASGTGDAGDTKCEMNMANIDTNKHAKLATEEATEQMMTLNNASGETLVPYITEENLLAAQSNIVNPVEYNKELQGVDNKNVYGSQGLDTTNIHIRGYDTSSEHLGTLTFDII
jgi:hypothetical protein